MVSRSRQQRYCRCGTHLAKDNGGRQCARCERTSRDKLIAPPEVPPEFWETEQFREAFAARHMGRVSRAYRTHLHHYAVYGPSGISQTLLGQWLGLRQPQISRFENGPPFQHLDTLQHWARMLRIPAELLWFDMPGETRQAVTSLHSKPNTKSESATDERSSSEIPSRPNLAALLAAPPEQTIAYLKEQWHLLVRADNLFGPAHALHLVHEQIELIEALLRDARDNVRTPLLSLGAQYAESAAWLHEDASDQLAPLWTSRALEWAHAGSDHRLVAWTLFRGSSNLAGMLLPAEHCL